MNSSEMFSIVFQLNKSSSLPSNIFFWAPPAAVVEMLIDFSSTSINSWQQMSVFIERIIINNQMFDNEVKYPYRQGADVDANNLDILFTQLEFKVGHQSMKPNR